MAEFKPQRRHDIRLSDYDYSSPGTYYVTVVLKDRASLFGSILENGVKLSAIGRLVYEQWMNLQHSLFWVELDEFVVMPDHLHGLIILGSDPANKDRISLGSVIQRFKSTTTVSYGKGVREHGWPMYEGKLWAPNYYERIVRNAKEFAKIQNYIRDNPYRWMDKNRS